ncbi:caspase family protein [Frigidibacter sp. ROC022]|uniref:caspase family protein n=1 Tax=Frigidibacter sp. ROC022 TaxID=2971796 RepID=UPI00215A72D7|nr:caspase family protein [Frigidibacter sp. ROC022]MCR8723468.1 caspase family protein [Frigidibacter sp. ROC022]
MIRFLLTLILAWTASLAVAETRGGVRLPGAGGGAAQPLYDHSYALVIGMDRYSGGWPKLSNAVRDARAVAEALDRRGFEVTLKTDLDSRGLEDALEDFIYGHGQEERARLLIWYAGHGHMIGEEAYLVPIDAPAPQREGLFRRRAVSMRDFGKYMREVRAQHVLAIFDSCFSGNVFETTRAMPSPAITRATGLPVRQIISSGDAGQTVSDDGSFRRLFLDALSGDEPNADANHDGYLTGSELGLFLADKMTSLTLNRQTPRYGKLRELGFDRGDFVFRVAAPAGDAAGRAVPEPDARGAAELPEIGQVPAPAPPEAEPPAEPVPPVDEERLTMDGGQSHYFMDGRLVFSMVATPAGGRRDLVAVRLNGRKASLAIGGYVVADSETEGCSLTLLGIATGENRAEFLLRCGEPSGKDVRRAAARAVDLPPVPATLATLAIEGNRTGLLMEGRLLFSMIGTPAGGRSDLVAIRANSKKHLLSLGGYVAADGASDGCVLTLMEIVRGENKANFLVRCGARSSDADRKAAGLALDLDAAPTRQETFTMAGGTTRLLDPGGTVLAVTGTPAGGRGDLVGIVLGGKRSSLAIGQQHPVVTAAGSCLLTVIHIHKGENQADFLWTCG